MSFAPDTGGSDDGDERWWKMRQDEVDRVAEYIRCCDPRVREALQTNPARELVEKIASTILSVPRVVRRVGAAQREPMKHFHFIFHKPRGLLCQPRQLGRVGETHVRDALPEGYPSVPFAGRLDGDTEGLLLFSDNGKLLNALICPDAAEEGGHVEKTYFVQCSYQTRRISQEPLSDDQKAAVVRTAVESMRLPIEIKGSVTQPAVVELCSCPAFVDEQAVLAPPSPRANPSKKRKRKEAFQQKVLSDDAYTLKFWVSVCLVEGKNRQIRRLCSRAHLQVLRLIRAELGPLSLGSLRAGQCRQLTEDEVRGCYAMAGMPEPFPGSMDCPVPTVGADLLHLVTTPPEGLLPDAAADEASLRGEETKERGGKDEN